MAQIQAREMAHAQRVLRRALPKQETSWPTNLQARELGTQMSDGKRKCKHCSEDYEEHKNRTLECPNKFYAMGYRDSKRWMERRKYEEKEKVQRERNPYN